MRNRGDTWLLPYEILNCWVGFSIRPLPMSRAILDFEAALARVVPGDARGQHRAELPDRPPRRRPGRCHPLAQVLELQLLSPNEVVDDRAELVARERTAEVEHRPHGRRARQPLPDGPITAREVFGIGGATTPSRRTVVSSTPNSVNPCCMPLGNCSADHAQCREVGHGRPDRRSARATARTGLLPRSEVLR